ncbi:DUF4405 domain-containing protein [Candidatus Neomarinimicrobiota bacterium]
MKKQSFNTKAFTSFAIAFAFLISSVLGIILCVVPQGRIANWTSWTLLGLEKEQWGAIHTLFVLMLLVAITLTTYSRGTLGLSRQ